MVKKTILKSDEKSKSNESQSSESNSKDNTLSTSLLSDRLHLKFPISISKSNLKDRKCADKVSTRGAIFLSGVIDYIVEEILYGAIEVVQKKNEKMIKPIHIQESIVTDNSFYHWLKTRVIVVYDKSTMHNKTFYEFLRYESKVYDQYGNLN